HAEKALRSRPQEPARAQGTRAAARLRFTETGRGEVTEGEGSPSPSVRNFRNAQSLYGGDMLGLAQHICPYILRPRPAVAALDLAAARGDAARSRDHGQSLLRGIIAVHRG